MLHEIEITWNRMKAEEVKYKTNFCHQQAGWEWCTSHERAAQKGAVRFSLAFGQ